VDKPHARNSLDAAVTKFCLAVEEHRRTPEGRVRTSQDFLVHFFPHDEKASTDHVFRHLPNEVRGPILSSWGIRGLKAALRDTDAKVESVVHDALLAGDIDHAAFEQGLPADTMIRWVPLPSWWTFWRGGKLSKKAIHKAFEAAYDVGLLDARWFFDTIEAKGGKARGTDVIAEGLTKSDLTEWIRRVHQSGDGTPRGLVSAIGWEKMVNQTANEVLVAVLDALAAKSHLSGVSGVAGVSGVSGVAGAPGAAAPSSPRPLSSPPPARPLSSPPAARALSYAAARIEVRDNDAPELQVGEAEVSADEANADLDEEPLGKDTLKEGAQSTMLLDGRAIPVLADEEDIEPTAVFHMVDVGKRGGGRSR